MRRKKLLSLGAFLAFCAVPAFSTNSADLWQGGNGSPGLPNDPVVWTQGNPTNSHYLEGQSIPYRIVVTGITNGPHNLTIEWDIRQDEKNAIDYITHYERLQLHANFASHDTAEAVNPLSGLSDPFGSPETFPIPEPSSTNSVVAGQPAASFNALPANERVLTIWNGTITNAAYISQGDLSASNASTVLSIDLLATNSTVVLAWGGHIASKADWGPGNTASGNNGSPYHTRQVSLDGTSMAQDEYLESGTVVFPPSINITGPTSVCAESTNTYTVITDAPEFSRTIAWTLANNTCAAQIVGSTNETNVVVSSPNDGSFELHAKVITGELQNIGSVQITANPLTVAGALTNQTVCPGSSVTFWTLASGTAPLTFAWSKDGNVIEGATNDTLYLASVSTNDAGFYCVQVTGGCNSVTNCATLAVEVPPTATCPPDTTVECIGDVPAPDADLVVFTGGTITATAEHFEDAIATNGCELVITRTYKITDACGAITYCDQLITVKDTLPPVLTGDSNLVVECGTPWDFEAPTVVDNCLGTNVLVEIVGTLTNPLCGNTFIATRTWQAVDKCTNISTFSQTVSVADTTPPAIFCSSNIVVECAGPPGTIVTFDVSAFDGCDSNVVAVSSPPSGTMFALGENTVVSTAMDDCSNVSQCSFTVTVVDTTPPDIVCPTNLFVEESPRESGFAPVTFASQLLVTDVCDASPASGSSHASGSDFAVGNTTVQCFAVDESGNTNTCQFVVRVIPYRLSVTTTNDSGPGSLREALSDANAASGENLIVFEIQGTPPHRIELLSALPEITAPVIIDGWSQTNFSGTPIIEINGTQAVGPVDGLSFTTGSNTVRGLVLNGFATAIRIEAGNSSVIQGNYIGTDPTGTNVAGNSDDGIFIMSAGNQVGGTNAPARNVIAGNSANGIHFATPGALGNLVRGNYIGLGADSASPLGNGSNGVFFADGAAANNVTGGNEIVANGANGVAMSSTAGNGNAVFGNRIHGNALIGIDLDADGPTPNDDGDVDEGPNRLQNRPELEDIQSVDGFTFIKGSVNSQPNRFYRLEFYLNDNTNASGYSQGHELVGSSSVFVHADGNGDFNPSFPLTATAVQFVTATVMDPDGNSSEFSLAKQVRTPPVLESVPGSVSTDVGSNVTFCATASGTPPIHYQWRLNGQSIPGATNFCYTVPAAEIADGGSYSVVVGNDLGAVETFPSTLSLNLPPLAGADNFADAVLFSGTNGLVVGWNTNASREAGEPDHAGKPGGKSLWYRWQPPDTGITTVGTTGSLFDTLLGVYKAANPSSPNVSNLVAVASDEDRGGYFASGLRFNAIKHSVYYIAIDGYRGRSGEYIFKWSHEKTSKLLPLISPGPVSQTVLPGATVQFSVVAHRVCAQGHGDCNSPSHYALSTLPILYFQWLHDGEPIGGETNSVLNITNVQIGSVGEYTVQVTFQDRTVESDPALLQINETEGVAQNAQTRNKLEDAFGAPPLMLGTFAEPFSAGSSGEMGAFAAAAVVVSGYSGSQIFTTTRSTGEGEIFCGVIGGASEWLSFLPGETGLLYLNTDGSSFDTLLAVMASNSPPQLIACDNNSGQGGTNSSVIVPVEAGKFYFIGVDGVNGASGQVVLNYSLSTATASLTAPQLVPLPKTNAAFRFRVLSISSPFVILVSTNFASWAPLSTNPAPPGVFDYMDWRSTNFSRRFYNIQLLP